jgi:nucleotidyltransferase/DNA polymerase involved in DNA repair
MRRSNKRDNPELRGRPVAVGHGAKRGVVATASYEARALDVRSAMPATTMRHCADIVFVRPRFDVYRAISHQINAIFANYTSVIEPLSLDEAYRRHTGPAWPADWIRRGKRDPRADSPADGSHGVGGHLL